MLDRAILLPPADKEPKKSARILHFLYEGGTLNRFEAASKLHDTCLNSTVSTLRNGLGVTVCDRIERVKGYKGLNTICKRYWLEESPCNLETVYQVLVRQFGYKPGYRPAASALNHPYLEIDAHWLE